MTDAEGNEIGKVFIGGLSQATNDDSLRCYFSQHGRIDDCVVMMDNKTGRSRGFGYIKFQDESSVTGVLESGPHLLDGKIVDVKQCNIHMKGRNRRSLKIFVGGIGLDDNEETIRQFFSQYGNVSDVNLMLDQTKQRHRGFAFVGFDEESVVKELIIKHFVTMNGKCVEIKAMEPPNFARKLVVSNETSVSSSNNIIQSNGIPSMIVCNTLPHSDSSQPIESSLGHNAEEKVIHVAQQPHYSLQPIIWNNSNQLWNNPYQFDNKVFNSNCLYSAQPQQTQQNTQTPNPCHYHQCISNNNPMWTMVAPPPPQQSTQPQPPPTHWNNYQLPLNTNHIVQYSSVTPSTWQYNPYFLQFPQLRPVQINAIEKSVSPDNNESLNTNSNSNTSRLDDSTRQLSGANDPSAMSIDNTNTDEYWLYNNTSNPTTQHNNTKEISKVVQTSQNNEHLVRPNGDDNSKQSSQQLPFNNTITDFNFFQSTY